MISIKGNTINYFTLIEEKLPETIKKNMIMYKEEEYDCKWEHKIICFS